MHELTVQPINTNFPQDWENPMLEEVCSLVTNGYVGPTRDIYRDSGIPYLVSKNVKPNQIIKEAFAYVDEAFQRANQRSILKEGDVLTVQTGFIGDSCVVPKEFDGANCHALIISRPISDKLHSRWLSEYFNSELGKAAFSQIATGMAHPHLNSTLVRKLRIPIPPYAEQKVAAQILDTIDSTIAHTSTLIAKLKQMKAGLLHDLLTRGLDENGKLRDAIEHPEQFKDSPLGQIPKDWTVESIGEACSLVRDGTHLPPKRVDDGPFLLSVQNMIDGQFQLTESDTKVSWDFYRTMHRNWEIQTKDVLLAIVGATLGKTAIVPPKMPAFTLQRSVAVLRGKAGVLDNSFLHLYLSSERFQRMIWHRVNQTAQPGLYLAELEAFKVPIPDPEEQKAIHAVVEDHRNRIQQEEAYLNKLKEQKKGLMHDLLTGRVRVTDLKEIPA